MARLGLELADRRRVRGTLVDWFRRLGASPPRRHGQPASFRGAPLALVVPAAGASSDPSAAASTEPSAAVELRIYERYGSGPTYVVGVTAAGETRFALDFSAWRVAPEVQPGDESLVVQSLKWAALRDGILYVAHAHDTYAASSKGLNAYVTALRLPAGEIVWRSRPLVANAETFVVLDQAIIAGYGFTREDDALYVLDRETGGVVTAVDTKSAPQFLVIDDGDLWVRAYKHDERYAIGPR